MGNWKNKDTKRRAGQLKGGASIVRVQDNRLAHASAIRQSTQEMISDGLAKPTASTGKPIDELHGGALITARLSNIGGGSRETGGGGMAAGLGTLMQFASADATVKSLTSNQQHAVPALPKAGKKKN